MDFQLKQEWISPIELVSETEAFFLRYIIPAILIFPWIVYFLYILLKWVSKFFQGNREEFQYKQDMSWLGESPPPRERALSLRELEKLAEENPRKAIMELSRFFRVNYLKPEYRPFSLEYYIKEKEDSLFSGGKKWFNLFMDTIRSKFLHRYSPIFSEVVELAYSSRPLEATTVLAILKRVRDKEWED